ncbi:MAG: Gfo/Idh/MocA family oxidoreductase [Actinobacteria bacterium]|nr:Gfo/Idh/MocA family oxidoreductase [Actinomycetota bacterium]
MTLDLPIAQDQIGAPDPRPVRVGMIGLGTIHAVHAEAFKRTAAGHGPNTRVHGDGDADAMRMPGTGLPGEIVAVCDTDAGRARQVSTDLGCAAYTDYSALLNNADVDAVDITLPHSLHYQVASDALQSRKHVLVEKPMAPSSAQCRELIELARQEGLVFTVAENTRFVHAYQEAKKLLDAGKIGQPRLIRTLVCGTEVERLRDRSLWKGRVDGTAGGTIMDAGPHSFYLLKWLCGPVASLRAFGSKLVDESEVEDHAVVSGSLANGALFTSEFTFTSEMPWNERLEIHGTDGTIVVDQLANPPLTIFKGELDFFGTHQTSVIHDPAWWKGASIVAGVADFVHAVHDRRPATVDPWDGYYAMEIVEAAYRSFSNGGVVVIP